MNDDLHMLTDVVPRMLLDATPKGNSMSFVDRVQWLIRRSDERDAMREELIRILDVFPHLRSAMLREGNSIMHLAVNVHTMAELLRSTQARLDLAEEAMRRALAERDALRNVMADFIAKAKGMGV